MSNKEDGEKQVIERYRNYIGCAGDFGHARRLKILEILNGLNPSSLLDIGCGQGLPFSNFKPEFLCGVDLSSKELKGAKKAGYTIIVADVQQLPIKENTFCVIVCSEILEHLLNPHLAISEIRRVLKRGGKVLVTVPTVGNFLYAVARSMFEVLMVKLSNVPFNIRRFDSYRVRMRGGLGHIQRFDSYRIKKMLEGFEVVDEWHFGTRRNFFYPFAIFFKTIFGLRSGRKEAKWDIYFLIIRKP